MAVYAISDLHLALSIDKPMDIFGSRWANYMEKIQSEWTKTVRDDDYVIIPGDISWATYLEQAVKDFRFINELPGSKIISKGNHDYWWTTNSKLEQFLNGNNFSSISFMHNNSFILENTIVCGTRGWESEDSSNSEDAKIFKREMQRLEMSLKAASGFNRENIVAALHYPPFGLKKEPNGFVDIMLAYGVKTCVYGHLHGEGFKNAVEGEIKGINFKLISADYLNFTPFRLA